MTGKTILITLALLLGATAIAAAQSQRNYGANGPSSYGCYGSFSTGTVASSCPGTLEADRGRSTSHTRKIRHTRHTRSGRNGSGSGCTERPRAGNFIASLRLLRS